jgi:predicted  nucleic acid-binding Zn-ribbon protein
VSLGGLLDAQAGLERDIEAASSRIQVIEQRLYHGEGVAYRDQQAMADEVKHLEQRRAGVEDQEIDLMESMEPLEAELAELGTKRSGLADDSAALTAAIAATSRQIEDEAAQVRAEREKLAPGLPAELSATYEQLRARLGGIGAARLEHGSCSGCHLSLPSTELDRIRRRAPGEVFTCDQCGRILVP